MRPRSREGDGGGDDGDLSLARAVIANSGLIINSGERGDGAQGGDLLGCRKLLIGSGVAVSQLSQAHDGIACSPWCIQAPLAAACAFRSTSTPIYFISCPRSSVCYSLLFLASLFSLLPECLPFDRPGNARVSCGCHPPCCRTSTSVRLPTLMPRCLVIQNSS